MYVGSSSPYLAGFSLPSANGRRPDATSAVADEAVAADGPAASSRQSRPEAVSGDSRSETEKTRQLRERDREVRAHEAAHMAAGGELVRGGMSLEYERGPDGRMYAVGGEVEIDTSRVPGDPEATLEKAEKVRRAALAPAEPSGKDRQVAAEAAQMATQARAEIAKARREGAGAYAFALDAAPAPGLDVYA